MRLAYDSDEQALAAAHSLRALGGVARRILAECVEKSEVRRHRVSPAVRKLEDEGFVFVRPASPWDTTVVLMPSLAGEEALDALQSLEETPAHACYQGRSSTR